MTAQGHTRTRFRRAIERKNFLGAMTSVGAMTSAQDMGVVSLDEALDLICLAAEVAPDRFDSFARRWLVRLAAEKPLRLAELDLAVTALRALPSHRALAALRALL